MKNFLFLLCAILCICSCSSESEDIEDTDNVKKYPSIKLSHDSIEITIGHSEYIRYFLKHSIVTESPDISWYIDDMDIITGNELNHNKFEINSVGIGETFVVAYLSDWSDISDTCFVKIIPVYATSVVLNTNDLDLYVGEDSLLTAKVYPEEATSKEIVWESSDSDVVSVENGRIKALLPGDAVVSAILSNDGSIKAECNVHVKNVLVSGLAINELDKFSPEYNNLMIGDELKLTYTVVPENATNKNVIIKSSDPEIANIDENMVLHANSNGKVTITIESEDGNANNKYELEVGDITVVVTPSISGSYTNIMGSVTGEIYCRLNNRSNYDIRVVSMIVEDGYGKTLKEATSDMLGTIKAHSSSDGLGGKFISAYYPKFIWEYEYNGETYKVECPIK